MDSPHPKHSGNPNPRRTWEITLVPENNLPPDKSWLPHHSLSTLGHPSAPASRVLSMAIGACKRAAAGLNWKAVSTMSGRTDTVLPLAGIHSAAKFSPASYIRVMLQKENNTMHVQPPLPEVGIHGKDRLPVGGKLGMARVRSAVLQGQHLRKWQGGLVRRQCSARNCVPLPREHRNFSSGWAVYT